MEALATQLLNKHIHPPEDAIPDGDRARDDALFQKGYTHFKQLFTKRNLLANTLLRQRISEMDISGTLRQSLMFVFSSSLSWSCKMRKDAGHGWEFHGFWIPETNYESNVWQVFEKQFSLGVHSYIKGKEYSNAELGSFAKFADNFDEIKSGQNTCLLLNKSSDSLPIPDNSVDAVITDPPFGGNVQYAELSDFWAIWLKPQLGLTGLIDNSLEAIQTRNEGFTGAKDATHYEDMLFKIFKECHRVLKKEGWMVLTFHNKELAVWMSLHRAANRAGFRLPSDTEDKNRGMLYQPPIEEYTTTVHQHVAGAMLGDFVLSFKRIETANNALKSGNLSTTEEEGLIHKASDLIKFHGGADDSTLMTAIIPYLNEHSLFGKLSNLDFRPLFMQHFVWNTKEKKWYTQDMVEPETKKLKPIDYIPAQQLTNQILYEFLKKKKFASLDEIVSEIYRSLVNSYRPGMDAINNVLVSLCDLVPLPGTSKRQGYRLKPESANKVIKPRMIAEQASMFGEPTQASLLEHNEIISLICNFAAGVELDTHVGETEQKKDKSFKEASRQMVNAADYGFTPSVFATIKEIDALILKGNTILAAFEVTTTVETADKAINNRFRNLFTAMPNLNIPAYVIVVDKDFNKAHAMVYSLANITDGVSKKIWVLKLSEFTKTKFVNLVAIK